jgi:glycosyltransferase involved in cell wall biosynthesis
MKIALVYPHSNMQFRPPRLYDALAMVNYELATSLARKHSVVAYIRSTKGELPAEHYENVLWRRLPVTIDRALNGLKVLDKVGLTRPERPFRMTGLYYAHWARRVARDIGARGCDIVHVHTFATFLPQIRRHNPNARIVLHLHDHSLTDFDARSIRARLELASLIFTCSDYVRTALCNRFPDLSSRCCTMHNGVDRRFLEIPSRPARAETVLFVGRMSPEKGVHVLIDAFRAIAHDHRRADLRLIGPLDVAPKQFVDPFNRDERLRRLARFYSKPGRYMESLWQGAVPLGARVRFDGPIANAELGYHYSNAALFVFPSIWHEPFGIPIIEAMAAGLPVITTRGGAASEVVVDGQTGFLVDRGDTKSLAAAMDTLLRDPQLRERMGAAGRHRVASLFTWDGAVARLEKLYERALGISQPAHEQVDGLGPEATSDHLTRGASGPHSREVPVRTG